MAAMMSTIYLCSGVPLSNRYDHTIYFENPAAQNSYFQSKVADMIVDVSYLRKSWTIKIPRDMNYARLFSYLFFKNADTGKTWYYFITDVEYINDNTTELTLELDVMQTYMFDWALNPCFVEREHTTSDNIGEHTVDENLDTGELITNTTEDIYFNDCCILILSTVAMDKSDYPNLSCAKYNNMYGGAGVYAVDVSDWEGLGAVLDRMTTNGKIDGVIALWMYPKKLVTLAEGSAWGSSVVFKRVTDCQLKTFISSMQMTLDGYTPRNMKTLCYPYNMLYVTNNVGGAAVYHYERFGWPSAPSFNMLGTLSAEGVAYLYPIYYKGVQNNYDEGLQMSGFPQCSWNADTYKLWLAQNQNQHQLAAATSGLQIAAGAATFALSASTGNLMGAGAGAATIAHGVSSVASLMAQKKDMSIQPPQARGNQSGSLNMVATQMGYTFHKKSVDAAHAKAIDDFFSLYGYAVHRVKKPTLRNRDVWTYVKTRDSNVTGNVPHADLQKINAIFDAGITFWAIPDFVGQYTYYNEGVEVWRVNEPR